MRNRLFVALALSVAFAAPALGATADDITRQQVEAAREARTAASSSLETSIKRFEQAVVDETLVRERIVALSKSISLLEVDIATKQVGVEDLVVARYTSGGSSLAARMFSLRTFTDLPVQSLYLEVLNEVDLAVLRGLETVEAQYGEQQLQLDASLSEQVALVAEIGELTEQILATLESADTDYNTIAVAYQKQEEEKRLRALEEQRLREEAEKKAAEEAAARKAADEAAHAAESTTTTTTAATTTTSDQSSTTTTVPATTTTTQPATPPPVITDGKACPINAATSFSDTWGAPRSGGRSHKGVDISAVRGAPVVAIETGRITRTSNSGLGGFSIYLTGESGDRYYYAHLEGFASGIGGGTAVVAGDLIGYNGTSGNAPPWLPHVHFQYAQSGGDWINPYPLVKALCG